MHNISLYIPTHEQRVSLDILAWSSTWDSVLQIEYAEGFEERYRALAREELAARNYEQHRRDWELATAVTTGVFSVAASFIPGVGNLRHSILSFLSTHVLQSCYCASLNRR